MDGAADCSGEAIFPISHRYPAPGAGRCHVLVVPLPTRPWALFAVSRRQMHITNFGAARQACRQKTATLAAATEAAARQGRGTNSVRRQLLAETSPSELHKHCSQFHTEAPAAIQE